MKCPRCDRAAEHGQRFCNGCGLQLTGDDGSTLLRGAASDEGSDSPNDADRRRVAPTAKRAPGPSGAKPTPSRPTTTTGATTGTPVPSRPNRDDTAPRTGTDGLAVTPPSQPAAASTRRAADASPPPAQGQPEPSSPVRDPSPQRSDPTAVRPIVPARSATPDTASTRQPPANVDATSVNYVPPLVADPTRVQGVATGTAVPATAVVPMTTQGQPMPRWRRFRFSTTAVLGLVVAVLSIASIFVRILRITTTPAVTVEGELPYAFRLGSWYLGDLGSNLPMALLIVAVLSVIGAVAAGYGWTWGAGLVGGASLSLVGIAAMVIGFAQMPIDGARQFAQIPTETPFNVLITRDVGYWMFVGTGALGIIAAFASLNECFADRQRDLNPWIAAVGALSVVATVGGVLLPVQQAVFSDNWYVIQGVGEAPPMLVAGRLVQLALLLIAGVVGFLLVRPYGLGLAMGGTLPTVWLGVSVLLQPGRGVGPGWRNPGAASVDLHGLTIIGLATLVSMLVLACLSAYNQYATRTEIQQSQPPARGR